MMGLSVSMSEATEKVTEHRGSRTDLGRRETLNTPKSPIYLPHGWLKSTLSIIKLKARVHWSVEKRDGYKIISRTPRKRKILQRWWGKKESELRRDQEGGRWTKCEEERRIEKRWCAAPKHSLAEWAVTCTSFSCGSMVHTGCLWLIHPT